MQELNITDSEAHEKGFNGALHYASFLFFKDYINNHFDVTALIKEKENEVKEIKNIFEL